MATKYEIGDRLSYDGVLCTLRYIGEVAGTSGSWYGVEWDDPSRGKHDGQHKGVRYFECRSKSATAASFVRPTRPVEPPLDFVAALQEKYASEVTKDNVPIASQRQIVISGKVAEEVGFDKIRLKLGQLGNLKVVILDGMRVVSGSVAGKQSISDVCPKVTDLDLSRNLFTRFGIVVEICSELKSLRTLRVSGNRFVGIIQDGGLDGADVAFHDVKELAIEENILTWEELCHITTKFPALVALGAGMNQFGSLSSPIPSTSPLITTLVSLNLEYNGFTSLSDLTPLTELKALKNLHLKGNNISSIAAPSSSTPTSPPIFSPELQYLDISYNSVTSWSFIDALTTCFPGMVALRFAHNPLYDNPAMDDDGNGATTTTTTTAVPTTEEQQAQKTEEVAPGRAKATQGTDDAYMLVLARLPQLRALNFSAVSPADRTDADMFYLSRIARQLAALSEGSAEGPVLARHPRWEALCDAYGTPVISRRKEVDPNFLEARLVAVAFYMYADQGDREGPRGRKDTRPVVEKHTRIPKAFDIYAVKGIAAKLFGHAPLKLRLIWETGEWDPVSGFDEDAVDSSEDEAMERELERKGLEAVLESSEEVTKRLGKWVKREVELKDGPRQFGYCVDGLEVRIRVELR